MKSSFKKVIAVDIDEVLAGFIDYFLEYHNQLYKTEITRVEVLSFDLHEVFQITREEIMERMVKFGLDGHNVRIKLVPGAKEGVDALLKKGYELHLVTARPSVIKPETEQWITRHFPNKFSDLHNAFNANIHQEGSKKQKWEICKEIGAQILIEDHLPNAIGCSQNGITTYLMDTPWNQQEHLPANIIRVKSWMEIVGKL